MGTFGRACAVLFSMAAMSGQAAYQGAFDGTFKPVAAPRCYDPDTYDGYTVGGQYLDPHNGVLFGMHSMLVRWQGDAPFSRVWVDCVDFGMTIDTRAIPHRPIEGGGYNDMYGYAWAPGYRPRPFVHDGAPTHLVLQANVAVDAWLPTAADGSSNAANTSADSCLFAYLRDTRPEHQRLHPIAILACTHVAGDPVVHGTAPAASFDYVEGVWFGAGFISTDPANDQPLVSTYYTEANTKGVKPFGPIDGADMPFFRAHIRPEDWIQLVDAIERHSCEQDCPARGYSRDPADYELEYAGLLVEAAMRNDAFEAGMPKPEVVFAVRGRRLGIYRGIPNGIPADKRWQQGRLK